MIAVGAITAHQEDVLGRLHRGRQARRKTGQPGVLVSEVNNTAFGPYIERGFLTSPDARTMPYNCARR